MQPIQFIRRHLFRLSQTDFAGIAGVRQSTVSRWEAGAASPDTKQIGRIREEAKRRQLSIPDSCFFELPVDPVTANAPCTPSPDSTVGRKDGSSQDPTLETVEPRAASPEPTAESV